MLQRRRLRNLRLQSQWTSGDSIEVLRRLTPCGEDTSILTVPEWSAWESLPFALGDGPLCANLPIVLPNVSGEADAALASAWAS